jgi:hypothetical protein
MLRLLSSKKLITFLLLTTVVFANPLVAQCRHKEAAEKKEQPQKTWSVFQVFKALKKITKLFAIQKKIEEGAPKAEVMADLEAFFQEVDELFEHNEELRAASKLILEKMDESLIDKPKEPSQYREEP